MLGLIAVAGVAGAKLLGVRSPWLSIATGLTIAVFVRVVTFSTLNMFGLLDWATPLFIALMLSLIVLASWRAWDGFLLPALIALGLAVLAVTATRILGFVGVGHGDSLWILTLTDLMERGGDMEILAGRTSIKRGFAYPLLLSLGPAGQYLTGLTPYIFAVLAAGVIWLAVALLRGQPRSRIWLVGGLLLAVTVTAVVPLRAIFYLNGHTLTAVGLLIAAGITVLAIKRESFERSEIAVLLLAIFTAAATRPEAIAIVALVVAPLISRRWISRIQVGLIVSAASVSLSIWLSTYHSYIINETKLPWFVFSAIFIGLGWLPALRIFDWLRYRLVAVALIAMVVVFAAAEVLFAESLAKGNAALWQNLIGGDGLWGWLVIALVLAVVLAGFKDLSIEYKTLLTISASLILGSLIAKMLDGGQFGNPTLGRIGWSDSLNRMWIHYFGIFLVTALVGLVQNERIHRKIK